MDWKIGRSGKLWLGTEGIRKLEAMPGRLEMNQGRLCVWDDERQALVGGVLENAGMDEVVRHGAASDWVGAIAARIERDLGDAAASELNPLVDLIALLESSPGLSPIERVRERFVDQPRDVSLAWGVESPAKHWNCRVIESAQPDGEVWFEVHEVFYVDGLPGGYSAEPATVSWSSDDGPDGGMKLLKQLLRAVIAPALKASDFAWYNEA